MAFDPNPPAIIRNVSALTEIEASAKAQWVILVKNEELNFSRFLELAKTLGEAKAVCKHGEWLPFLHRVGLNQRYAWDLLQINSNQGTFPDLLNCHSINQAMEMIREGIGKGEEEEIADPANASTKPKNEAAPKHTIYCMVCDRALRLKIGKPKRGCPECKAARAAHKAIWGKPKGKRKSKGGHIEDLIGMGFRTILRHMDRIAKDFGKLDDEGHIADTPALAEIRKMLKDAAHKLRAELDQLKEEAKRAQQAG